MRCPSSLAYAIISESEPIRAAVANAFVPRPKWRSLAMKTEIGNSFYAEVA
ncbi:hypothetical protein [uncultured Fibrobacter sp.]|uniref:hypothetical protein n=1 Tax=uncultured Fibrobacter sp. TaxID=261512 RepID=UPI00280546A6|nr:hypothetical protein [uncultured Fibrobacter sp.]